MKARIVKRGPYFSTRVVVNNTTHEEDKFIRNFSAQPKEIKINYCKISLKSILTENMVCISDMIFAKYNTRIDLINLTDNIVDSVDLSLFTNINKTDENAVILGNMIYNEVFRVITYLKTLYSENEIDYKNFLVNFNNYKDTIASQMITLLA